MTIESSFPSPLPKTEIPPNDTVNKALSSLDPTHLIEISHLFTALAQIDGSLAQHFFRSLGVDTKELLTRFPQTQPRDPNHQISSFEAHVIFALQNASDKAKRDGREEYTVDDIFTVESRNPHALAFFAKLGFKTEAERHSEERARRHTLF